MWKTTEGSTGRLIQFCLAYFSLYVIYGIAVKYLRGPLGMDGMALTVYATIGGSVLIYPIVIGLKWYRLQTNRYVEWAGRKWPSELVYIIPSGVCTAVVILTTTLMYTLPITVMVAMTMMRGSVIVISRIVDAIQIRQGILHKRVYLEENLAVLFAVAAVGVHIYYGARDADAFDFAADPKAMTVFFSYIGAYAVRIYLMNYFKNTRGKGVRLDNKGFFTLEQFAASGALVIATVLIVGLVEGPTVSIIETSLTDPFPNWHWAVIAGTVFGGSAFFSVFLFMFKGRTATFAGLVNRLTSLVAGTTATLIFWVGFDGKAVEDRDWVALGFVVIAVGFLTRAERRRAAELAARGDV